MTETGVIRALCGAIDDLNAAEAATKNGEISDHCENAITEIKKAMRLAIFGFEE